MCKQHALRIAWTIARSIAFLDFRVLRWKFTYDWKCVNTTYRVPLFCPLPVSRKGLRLTLRSALFGEGGRDWRPWISYIWNDHECKILYIRTDCLSTRRQIDRSVKTQFPCCNSGCKYISGQNTKMYGYCDQQIYAIHWTFKKSQTL